jgi:hypothetical protein
MHSITFFPCAQARAQLLPANRSWFAGTKGSEARTLKNNRSLYFLSLLTIVPQGFPAAFLESRWKTRRPWIVMVAHLYQALVPLDDGSAYLW